MIKIDHMIITHSVRNHVKLTVVMHQYVGYKIIIMIMIEMIEIIFL